MKIKTRPLKLLKPWVFVIFGIAFFTQVCFHHFSLKGDTTTSNIKPAPNSNIIKILSMGEQSAMAKLTILWLQSFDSQSGIKLRYSQLDYTKLGNWLDTILDLNPSSDYPLLLASQIYTMVPDHDKKRQALEYVHTKFLENPNMHWRWLSQCAVIAKHQLQDFDLAIKYAKAIREKANVAPTWAKQMEALLLDDIREYQTAEIILGGLISSKQYRDEKELAFLQEKLTEIKQRTVEK